jgi:hypothetical protein
MDFQQRTDEINRLDAEVNIDHLSSLDVNPAIKLLRVRILDEREKKAGERDDPRQQTEFRLHCIGFLKGLDFFEAELAKITSSVDQRWRREEREREERETRVSEDPHVAELQQYQNQPPNL